MASLLGMFRGLMGGGADVETTVHTQHLHPGQNVEGVVTATGGHTDRDVNFVELALIARVEVETDDSEYDANVVTYRNRISGPFRLQERARHQVPFSLPLPFETPFNLIARPAAARRAHRPAHRARHLPLGRQGRRGPADDRRDARARGGPRGRDPARVPVQGLRPRARTACTARRCPSTRSSSSPRPPRPADASTSSR